MAETNDQEQNPKALAYRAAVEAAEDPQDVGGYVDARVSDEDANIHDYRFESGIAGYEGWQWSITMYHDPDTGRWTVDESSLVPSDKALLAPRWIPWKERITPDDLSPTDVLVKRAERAEVHVYPGGRRQHLRILRFLHPSPGRTGDHVWCVRQ